MFLHLALIIVQEQDQAVIVVQEQDQIVTLGQEQDQIVIVVQEQDQAVYKRSIMRLPISQDRSESIKYQGLLMATRRNIKSNHHINLFIR